MATIPLSGASIAALESKGLSFVSCGRCGRRVRPNQSGKPGGHVRPSDQRSNAWSKAVRLVCRGA